MPSTYQLLAIDIDGTLVNSHDQLTPATRAALRRAAEAGIRLVLATGRRYSKTLHLVEPLGIEVPLVTAGGALVKDARDHRTLYQSHFDEANLRQALEIVDCEGFDPLLYGDTYEQGYDFYVPSLAARRPEMAEYLELNPTSSRVWPDMLRQPPPGIFAGFTMGTHQQMLAIEARLGSALPGRLQLHVLRSPKYHGYMCEISPAGVTKWSGVCWLARQWGIPDAAICAVGDDVNDLAMIRAAGLGVAMGNALPAVKAAADLVVPTHDEDGLVHVVDRLLA